jgi:hypothetical protein
MQPFDTVSTLVLSEISDDYEEFEHIYHRVAALSGKSGMIIRPLDVRQALVKLIETGLAKAYRLSTQGPAEEIQGVPLEDSEDVYYWITENGKIELAALD